MIRPVRIYLCDGTPTDEDIQEALNIAKSVYCIVRLEWHVKWDGTYTRDVTHNSTFEEVKESLPKIYGM